MLLRRCVPSHAGPGSSWPWPRGSGLWAFSGSKNAVLGRGGPAAPRSSRVQHLQPMLRPPGRVGVYTQLPRDVFAPCPLVVRAKSPAVVGDLVCNVTTVQFRFWPTLLDTKMCIQYIKIFRANLYWWYFNIASTFRYLYDRISIYVSVYFYIYLHIYIYIYYIYISRFVQA